MILSLVCAFTIICTHCQVLTHDIHFWIGKHSTPDKYGTAAYKTVDLHSHVSHLKLQLVKS